MVQQILISAMQNRKFFEVFVVETNPDRSGLRMAELLRKSGIKTTVIADTAVGFVMERINAVLVGSEGVVESGGIINKIGTYQMAIVANHLNVPVYVAVESFKFMRYFPFKQTDVINVCKYEGNQNGHPSIDYTPPHLIKLLFTDLGVLTPSAVSDELIRLYT